MILGSRQVIYGLMMGYDGPGVHQRTINVKTKLSKEPIRKEGCMGLQREGRVSMREVQVTFCTRRIFASE